MNVVHELSPAELQRCMPAVRRWMSTVRGNKLGQGLITIRETITQLEAIFADGLHEFDDAGAYAADGALSAVAG
jgi:hypothetical protein